MDPHKGGILQSVITFFLNIGLYVVYGILKVVYFFKKKDKFVEPSHVIPAPDKPISSFKLGSSVKSKNRIFEIN